MTESIILERGFCTHSDITPCLKVLDCLKSAKPLCQLSEHKRSFLASSPASDSTIIRVGLGSCGISAGAKKVYNFFKSSLAKNDDFNGQVLLKKTGCIGLCSHEVIVSVEKANKLVFFENVNIEKATEILNLYVKNDLLPEEGVLGLINKDNEIKDNQKFPINLASRVVLKNAGLVDPHSFEEYLKAGGMSAFNIAFKYFQNGQIENIIDSLKESGLRGRSGFSNRLTGEKWADFKEKSGEKIIVANCNESDSSSFVCRSILESDPFSALEGLMIAALVEGAKRGLIFLNPKYQNAKGLLENAIDKLTIAGLLGEGVLDSDFSLDIEVFLAPGSYVCGEESAIYEAVLGNRPHPIEDYSNPQLNILLNNVETLVNVVRIISNGPKWFKNIGTARNPGTKVISLSGKVTSTGYVEVPFGTSLREIIFEYGGGIQNKKAFKAVQIGGPTGGFLPVTHIDTPLDYHTLKQAGINPGLGSVVVLDEDNCIVNQTHYSLKVMTEESCGKCIPCREGLYRLVEMLDRISKKDQSNSDNLSRFQMLSQLEKLAEVIRETSSCGLDQNAVNPLLTGLRYFKDEFRFHVFEGKCVASQCKGLLNFKINAEMCRGCSICLERCPEGAIVGERKFSHFIITDKCTNCGICHEVCPFEAVEFY
ncbi:MAG: NADH-ubiquinone oxidoreductase-F iron-sulfur binding region domain-containing protein [Firmicutes bacterium]|nr:NADH-ubiquinone oxidoreductase-F iron-sulfur binding region domain-containing protein [Bacillota bacterium]